jgi:hypothetical protein
LFLANWLHILKSTANTVFITTFLIYTFSDFCPLGDRLNLIILFDLNLVYDQLPFFDPKIKKILLTFSSKCTEILTFVILFLGSEWHQSLINICLKNFSYLSNTPFWDYTKSFLEHFAVTVDHYRPHNSMPGRYPDPDNAVKNLWIIFENTSDHFSSNFWINERWEPENSHKKRGLYYLKVITYFYLFLRISFYCFRIDQVFCNKKSSGADSLFNIITHEIYRFQLSQKWESPEDVRSRVIRYLFTLLVSILFFYVYNLSTLSTGRVDLILLPIFLGTFLVILKRGNWFHLFWLLSILVVGFIYALLA